MVRVKEKMNIMNDIDKVRRLLHDILNTTKKDDKRVLEVSRQLDKLIVQYYK